MQSYITLLFRYLFPREGYFTVGLLSQVSLRQFQDPVRNIGVRSREMRTKSYRDEIRKMRASTLQKLLRGTSRHRKAMQKRPAQGRQESVRQIVPSMRKSPTGRH